MGRARRTDKCIGNKQDCFAYGPYAKCSALCNTNFKGECPFYKTALQRKKEHMASVLKLESEGKYGLIEKFGEQENQPRIWGEI